MSIEYIVVPKYELFELAEIVSGDCEPGEAIAERIADIFQCKGTSFVYEGRKNERVKLICRPQLGESVGRADVILDGERALTYFGNDAPEFAATLRIHEIDDDTYGEPAVLIAWNGGIGYCNSSSMRTKFYGPGTEDWPSHPKNRKKDEEE